MVDFPGTIAATVFTRGCSFRCPFCHNPELVIPSKFIPLMDEQEILKFFEKRFGKLEGVCITGGEPTLQTDLFEFIKKLKTIGYKIKLDTNGWNPKMLKSIIDSAKIDYIAMDIKSSPEKYQATTALSFPRRRESSVLVSNIKKSISLIMNSGIDYEFRTTVCHPIHEVADFEEIGKLIKGAKRYFIQNFVQSKHNDEKIKFTPFTDEELNLSKKIIQKYIKNAELR